MFRMFEQLGTSSIKQRVEEIADNVKSNTVEVIVQMGKPSTSSLKSIRKLAGEAISSRRIALNPREVFSSKAFQDRRDRKKKKHTSSSKKLPPSVSSFKKSTTSTFTKLLKSTSLQDSLSRMEDKFKSGLLKQASKTAATFKPATFWTSQSMLLSVTKKELQQLPSEIDSLQDVRLNRKLTVPIVKVSKPLSLETEDRLSTTWGLQQTHAYGAWGVHGAEGQGVTIAVLDTGVDATHPDLEGKVKHWAEFDGMGNIIDETNPRDSDVHGTHVAGTIVGGNDSGRWIGMAPMAEIAAGLVLDGERGGTDAQVLAGMDWAIDKGVDVINMSLGGLIMDAETPPTYSEAIVTAMLAGIPVVCAIGNEGEQTSGLPGSDLFALSVGATDWEDRAAGFSGGRTQIILKSDFLDDKLLPLPYIKPDLSAPGVSIRSCVPGGGHESLSGTSMATPHVSGAIALLMSAIGIRDDLEGADRVFAIHELLNGSVDDIGENGQDSRYGFGRLDALRAIDFAIREGFSLTDA